MDIANRMKIIQSDGIIRIGDRALFVKASDIIGIGESMANYNMEITPQTNYYFKYVNSCLLKYSYWLFGIDNSSRAVRNIAIGITEH